MNQVVLDAVIAEQSSMRFTPAGIPAIDLKLEHESTVEEGGQSRQIKLTVRSVALGAMAERLARQSPGTIWKFTGFLASPRSGKGVVFHVQEFQQI